MQEMNKGYHVEQSGRGYDLLIREKDDKIIAKYEGDYYNDIEMLKTAAHPVCCGQAPKDIKELSEYVACKCTDGAVADFINYIVKKYIKTEGT